MKKNKTMLFVLIGIFILIWIGLTVLFVSRGLVSGDKKWEYFNVYRSQAEEYIKDSSAIKDKYGDTVSIKFDNSVTYSESQKKGVFERMLGFFKSEVPDTLEEFTENIAMIKFNVEINGDAYEIIFEKNNNGKLSVSGLTAVDN